MASTIEGYNYDIFISYRQKDNKGDRWVSRFIEALKTEIEATFKEDISVYFDENPHDRLQETYDVDKSLEGKLKCLIFIPILSQTYCDPNSYAWQHEFLAFLKMVKNDRFGKDVRLRSGNVASRILPIRIHDLEPEDVKLFEKETGSVMRAMDFVFKTASGVNRPLQPEDNKNDNLNKTQYRDQINKVAGAIKEIILGMKAEPAKVAIKKEQPEESDTVVLEEEKRIYLKQPFKERKIRFIIPVIIVALLIIAGIIAYPKIFKRDTLERLRTSGERISVAVMPFRNMANDTTWNVWQDGIQDLLITTLSNSEELKIRQTESINSLIQGKVITNYASITPSIAIDISRKLDASVFIYGSIKKAGPTIRLNAQLIDSKTKDVIKPFQVEGPAREDSILQIIDSLSTQIKNFIIISLLKRKVSSDIQPYTATNSPDAYRFFTYGRDAYNKSDFQTAKNMLSKSVSIDSNFVFANIMLTWSLLYLEGIEVAKECFLKAYKNRDLMPLKVGIFADYTYSLCEKTPIDAIRCLKQLLEIDDQDPSVYFYLGNRYNDLFQPEMAIPQYEKALEIYDYWGSKPSFSHNYVFLGHAYHQTGQYIKEGKLYAKAEHDFPNNPELLSRQAILSFTLGDTSTANQYIDKYVSILKNNSTPETSIVSMLAGIYSEANILDKAEEYYKKALDWEPESITRINNYSLFLIDKNRNIEEGLALIDKGLEMNPDDYWSLYIKGLGLYKQGKHKESYEVINKSWELKPAYNHEIYNLLEKLKKVKSDLK